MRVSVASCAVCMVLAAGLLSGCGGSGGAAPDNDQPEAGSPTAFVEDFSTNSQEDRARTTANWNNRFNGLVGGQPGLLSSVFVPFAGDGAEGVLEVGAGHTEVLDTGSTEQRVYRFTSVEVAIGGQIRATGVFPLVIRCQGDVEIAGRVDLSGLDGAIGVSGDGTRGESTTDPGEATGGVGGAGGPGGFAGGDGGNTVTSTEGGHLKGTDGQGPGGGFGGYEGDTAVPQPLEGGGGGGHAEAGGSSDTAATSMKGDGSGGVGGDAYGSVTFSDAVLVDGVPTLTQGFGGSGGGGGGAEDDAGMISGAPPNTGLGDHIAANDDEGGGGGGGGGGALQITAYGDITVSGTITCNGGNGGATEDPNHNIGQGEAGGGGAGGAIWLQAYGNLSLDSFAELACRGGVGGNSLAPWRAGGQGAPGFIRLEDRDGAIGGIGSASVSPAASTAAYTPRVLFESVAYSTWFDTGSANPRYGVPDEVLSDDGGGVIIEYQATHEGTLAPGPDAGVASPWVTGAAIDQIQSRRWIRFRVQFSIPDGHPFDHPILHVDRVSVPIAP